MMMKVKSGAALSDPRGYIPTVGPPGVLGLPMLPNGQIVGLPNGLPQGAMYGLLVLMVLIPGSNGNLVRIEEDDYTIMTSICIHGIQESTNKLLNQTSSLATNQKLKIKITSNKLPEKITNEGANNPSPLDLLYSQMAKDLEIEVKQVIREVDRLFDLRSTRGAFDFIGRGLKFLVGVADDQDVVKFEKALEAHGEALRDIEKFQDKEVQNWNILHKVDEAQDNYIKGMVTKTDVLLKKAEVAEDNDMAIMNLISYIVNIGSTVNYIGQTVNEVKGVIEAGVQGRLSPYSISQSDLRKTLNHIETKEKVLSPLFGSDEIEMYYMLPLTKVHFVGRCVHSGLKVPLIDYRHTMVIKPITKSQMDSAHHALYVFEYIGHVVKQGYYSFFTAIELANCLKTEREQICAGRKAEITDPIVGDTVVHGISKVEFLVKLRKISEVTIYCPNAEAKVISLNTSCILTLPLPCNLVAPTFKIQSRNQKMEETEVKCCNISVRKELFLLDKKPIDQNSASKQFSPKDKPLMDLSDLDKNTDDMEALNKKLDKDRKIPAGHPSTPEIVLSVALGLSLLCLPLWCWWIRHRRESKPRHNPADDGKERFKISNPEEAPKHVA